MSKEYDIAMDNLIFRCITGSRAYGTNNEQSDTDETGIFIAPPDYTISCYQNIKQVQLTKCDGTIYELRRFMKLCGECNPNIIELLFTDTKNILYQHPIMKILFKNRHLFLSKKAKFTFSGYAVAQLKRIKGHNRWLNNPQPDDPPNLLNFIKMLSNYKIEVDGEIGLSQELITTTFLVKHSHTIYKIYSHDSFQKAWISDDGENICSIKEPEDLTKSKFVGTINVSYDDFAKARKKWKEYWNWKNNRNIKRSLLEEEHGYDVKHAMHLVRLLLMAKEILTKGEVIVNRPDKELLLSIRNGEWSYERLVKFAFEMDILLDVFYDESTLPHSVDKTKIDDLYRQILSLFWEEKGLKI